MEEIFFSIGPLESQTLDVGVNLDPAMGSMLKKTKEISYMDTLMHQNDEVYDDIEFLQHDQLTTLRG